MPIQPYTPRAREHTCIIVVEPREGIQTWVMYDGDTAPELRQAKSSVFVGTFNSGKHRIHVINHGRKLPNNTIALMLSGWIGGKWSIMTVKTLLARAKVKKVVG